MRKHPAPRIVVRQKNMSDESPAFTELFEKANVPLELKEAIRRRIAYSSEKEQLKVEALADRAQHPECSFDRKHRLMLCALALASEDVNWTFRLRERIHRFLCDH
jgi:hypothetical protein